MSTDIHIPVLLNEVLEGLHLQPDGVYVDGTLGLGGHSAEILRQSGPNSRLIGFDRDPNAIAYAKEALAPFGDRASIVHSSYIELSEQLARLGVSKVNGILLDLGLSSLQMDTPERGFTFREAGPLDMRFDPTAAVTAADLVNTWDETELADVIYRYGEERASRRIAKSIVRNRPIETTKALAEVVAAAIPPASRRKMKIHPATRTFQALRIAVNSELKAVEDIIPQAIEALAPGGRLAIISFHSLEDRLVKHAFREASRDCVCPPQQLTCICGNTAKIKRITRKPITATEQEIAQNPRSRSAKLRIAERC